MMYGFGDDNTTTNHFALNMPDQGFNENYFYPTLLWASLVADSSDLETNNKVLVFMQAQ